MSLKLGDETHDGVGLGPARLRAAVMRNRNERKPGGAKRGTGAGRYPPTLLARQIVHNDEVPTRLHPRPRSNATRDLRVLFRGALLEVRPGLPDLDDAPKLRQIFPGVAITGKNTETEVETARGGVRFATSVGGTLTGRGGNYIIIDDPMKPDEAMSAVARERIWQWFVGTVGSRLDNKADDVIVVVMQRLHVDDLVGRLLEAGGWHHLSIPAIAEIDERVPIAPGRAIQRKVGDVLDPLREPREVLDQIKRELGTAAFEAQYLQAPVPPDGGIVKWSWFKLYRDPPTRYMTDMVVHSWDTAMKAEQINDYSVGTVWLVRGIDYYLIDLVRARLPYPELKRAVRDLARKYNPKAVLIEDKGSGTSLFQELRWEGFAHLIRINPIGDKVTRLSTESAKIEAGQVHLPERAAWLADFQAEIKQFPLGKHDDQVDSMSQFLGWISKKHRYRARPDLSGYMGR